MLMTPMLISAAMTSPWAPDSEYITVYLASVLEYQKGILILTCPKEYDCSPPNRTPWHPHSTSYSGQKPLSHLGFSLAVTFYLESLSKFCWLSIRLLPQCISFSLPPLPPLWWWLKPPSLLCIIKTDPETCPPTAHISARIIF